MLSAARYGGRRLRANSPSAVDAATRVTRGCALCRGSGVGRRHLWAGSPGQGEAHARRNTVSLRRVGAGQGQRTWAGERPYILTTLCLFLRIGVAGVPSATRTLTRLRYATLPDLELSPVTVPSASDGGVSPMVPSSSSDDFSGGVGAQAMMNTPAKVAAQPYKKVTIWWKDARAKSP